MKSMLDKVSGILYAFCLIVLGALYIVYAHPSLDARFIATPIYIGVVYYLLKD